MIKKVVIPAAGLGTRLLPVTKEMPKEMLPIFVRKDDGRLCLKPMLQVVFEQLYDAGFREYGFIVGRGKRAIEDHFSPDEGFMEYLRNKNKAELAEELQGLYKKINDSTIVFLNQPQPKGFGDAVYQAKIFTKNEPFLLHAGDDIILSKNNDYLKRLMEKFNDYDADAIFLVEEVEAPRKYGVMVGNEIRPGIFKVIEVIEKPEQPPSNLAIIALYIFKPSIYQAIEKVKSKGGVEVELTDAVELVISWGRDVYALKLQHDEKRVDVGSPETYLETLRTMFVGF
jgi:UTP--glucose-1-phosphate uridylyltransferase